MATTSESHMLSSSSSSSSKSYEVFLSFYGKDTRGNITDHLYNGLVQAGIRTFRDNEELRPGDEIGPELMKAIQESKISIPVFSENYALSKWCLKELAEIMECKKNDGQIVWPIFYKVPPSHIRNQTGNFAEAFLQHQENEARETVDSWRNALKDAGNLEGWDSQSPENSYESNMIRSVVVAVLSELKKTTTLDVGKHLIGMDSRVDDIIRLLDLESQEDVQYVGICGIGGIGKSTIAKAVLEKISYHFNGHSKGWSFLEDVSSTSQQVEGLVKLQNRLVYDILGYNLNFHSVSAGNKIIKDRCCNKKALIILDNVDSNKQLDALARERSWFGPGSRIIITSRDRQILNVIDKVDTKIYMPEVLDENQSLKLFCNYAFREDQPLHNFLELSEKIVRSAGGLPLALRVLGSHLCRKINVEEWESELKRLNKIPHTEVQEVLKISFDSLHEYDKEIFLDIACFFIGMDKEIVIHILEDYIPKARIDDLVLKSLVSIDDNNMLRMHDLLRDMGREIVRQKSPKNVGERTRLWSRGDALDVLKKGKGTSSIEGLSLPFGHDDPVSDVSDSEDDPAKTDHCLKIEAFKPMSDLRLLQVDGAHFDGNFDALSTKLKWLSWKLIPPDCILSISHLRKLSVLDLSLSFINEDWNGWQHIQKLKKLKVLNLGHCWCLKRTPDFSYNTSLQRLILDGCVFLVACDESIGCLKKLVYLSLKDCIDIKVLPDRICKLSSLTNLILSGCRNLEKLPKALGDMKSLTELMIDNTDIHELPDSIGSLEKLVRLSAEDCSKLDSIPHSMGKLRCLQYINLLRSCINEIPECFGNLCSLKELKMGSSTRLLPSLFLNLLGWRLFHSIPELPLIFFELNVMLCASLESLPNLSIFKSLECLHVYHCEKLTKIEGLNGLSLLRELDLTNCKMLQSLPELPSSLIRLNIQECSSVESSPNLSNLKILKEIYLCNCEMLTGIEDLNGLTLLQQLVLKNCGMLQSLPELPPSLTRLYIEGCKSMKSLPNLSDLNKLEEVYLVNCEKITEIEGLTSLSMLQQLDLTNCKMLQTLPELPSSLIKLNIGGCDSMASMPNLSNLNKLEVLQANDCEKLIKIEGMNGSLLQELDLRNCLMLQSLPELPPTLTRLDIEGCESMESLPNLSNLNILEHLCLDNCGNLAKIEGMGGLSLLKQLDLRNCVMLQSLPELPPSLISIDISYCRSMEILANLSSLENLQLLYLDNCEKLIKIEGMNGLSLLQQLDLTNCKMLQSLPELPPSLTKLQVRGCMKLSEIEGIIGLSLLKVLDLYDCRELRSLLDLSNLKKLEELLLERCDNLVEIRGLESLESLKYFRVLECNTWVKTLQKCVAQGMLVGAFHGRNINKIYGIPDNDENIKGMALLLVYQTPLQLLGKPIHLKVKAVIKRNDGERIRCCHDLQIEGMTGIDVDGYYSCYFHGLTWFGLPLRKQYIIQVTKLGEPHQEANKVRIKMFVIIPEYETTEDSQQLEKRIAPLLTCTSVESEGVNRDKKPDDDADPSNFSCSQQKGVQRGNKRKWEHDDDDDDARS